MKFSVRRNVFETNSSSTHSITMCTESDYGKWKKGELIWDYDEDKLIPVPEGFKERDEEGELIEDFENLYTYERFDELEYEIFENSFVTPSGEEVIAFGYYGNDY